MSENIQERNQQFESSSPQEILQWAIHVHKPTVAMTSSFGAQSAALLHMAVQIEPNLPILFIDTGFLFKETYAFANDLKAKLNLNLKTFRPSDEEIREIQHRLDTNADTCCDNAKVGQMKKALSGLSCWIAGLRRNQAKTRDQIQIVEAYSEGLIKVHPLANWTSKDVYQYITQNNLPFHPLWEKGYTSIGCEPCTRKPTDPADERSGRWSGQDKTECGIHTFLDKKDN